LITTSYIILSLFDIENSSDAPQLQRFSRRVALLCHTQHSAYAVWYNVQSCTPIRCVLFSFRLRIVVVLYLIYFQISIFFYAYYNFWLPSSNVRHFFKLNCIYFQYTLMFVFNNILHQVLLLTLRYRFAYNSCVCAHQM